MRITIACKTHATAPLNALEPIQGMLKELSEENFVKLKHQIMNQGFSAPFFVWKDKQKLKILDGTQRYRVLSVLQEEGYHIPELPYVEIQADSEQEASQKLLSFVSQYGKTTTEGLYEFINKFEIPKDFLENLAIPELNLEIFTKGFLEDNNSSNLDEEPLKIKNQCPNCGHILDG
jgi:hypothetical protein